MRFFEPQPRFIFRLMAWVFFQAMVIRLQDTYGPRFFMPQRFRPHRYNYYRSLPQNGNDAMCTIDASNSVESPDNVPPPVREDRRENECAICMCVMVEADAAAPENNEPLFMVTPCRHAFHRQCLEKWMLIKMECPSCRQPLPPP
eukprot:Opistho-2@65261